jgi:D-beta-D-heptose 7-phosphate kinase/D-beta-D-heptose 1-phosphate adenosyltransferase
MAIVCVSGGFDPVHSGHLDYIREAAQYGRVYVILNSDDWLIRKKNFFFMGWKQRADILREMRSVSEVWPVDDKDDSVCEAIRAIKPDYFANGGDRSDKTKNNSESGLCKDLGITELFNVGGGKRASSTEMAWAVARKLAYE